MSERLLMAAKKAHDWIMDSTAEWREDTRANDIYPDLREAIEEYGDEGDYLATYESGLTAENAALRAQVERLEELVKLKDELLCCYRIGKRPAERLLNRLAKLAAVLRETDVDTETGRE